ncbi:MAG: uroporphyrinogen-III synthase [Phycisphaerae bacterium]|nr:uroporphyrinogen-III synthase [Phycisphaerae bacterium]
MTTCRGRIAILREVHRAEPLRMALVEAGFEVMVRPVTRVERVGPQVGDDWPGWAAAADWMLFTSLNGVDGFAEGAGGGTAMSQLLRSRRIAVLGFTSAERLSRMGVSVEVLCEHGTSAELAPAMLAVMEPRSTVVYPCAERTMPTLPRLLREAGHHLRQIVCYRTRALSPEERSPLDWSIVDAAVVAAPSAVRALGDEEGLPPDLGFYAIGPTTAVALREAGLTVLGVARSPKAESIVAMLKEPGARGEWRMEKMENGK